MFGTGVASFGHVHGVHMQNVDNWDQYISRLEKGELPLNRALPVRPQELLIREMILQLKTGSVETAYFRHKFGVDILETFSSGWDRLRDAGFLELDERRIRLTREGLLQIDRHLPIFFETEHQGARYT